MDGAHWMHVLTRFAVLYDIHGNLPALDAVLEDVRRAEVEAIVVGGDVFPGPMAAESLDRLLGCGISVIKVRGNGERTVLECREGGVSDKLPPAARAAIEWHAAHLGPRHEKVLKSFLPAIPLMVPGTGRVLFVHATQRSDTDIFTERTPDEVLRRVFAGADTDVVLCGHTHIQFDRRVDDLRIVNAGSVGMPFDGPGACWALIDGGVTLMRTTYDIDAAATMVCRTSYPGAAEFADRYILKPPTREATLDLYAAAELR
jgi:predicted phosphodiesterase